MAKPPPDLRQSLKKHDARAPAPVVEKPAPEPRDRDPHYRASRDGATNLTGYFAKPVKFQLQELSIELSKARGERVTLQDLQAEALNDLFAKYGKPEIAPSWGKDGQR
jgi:hypothetical protein